MSPKPSRTGEKRGLRTNNPKSGKRAHDIMPKEGLQIKKILEKENW